MPIPAAIMNLPFHKGFLYLFIIIDWYTRQIVDSEISYSLEKKFVLRCLRRALDNVRTELFFRSLKYDDIYIKEYATPREMIAGVNNYIHDYNTIRPHASLGGLTPNAFSQLDANNPAA